MEDLSTDHITAAIGCASFVVLVIWIISDMMGPGDSE